MSLEEPFKMLNKNETSKPKVTKASVTKAFAPKRIFIRDIDFDLNSAKVSSKMKLVLDSAVRILKKQKGEILVEGFTCDIGNEKYNKGLSKRRAMAVKACLVSKGIPALRIITRGFGEKRPKFTNKNEAGRRLNRRVEIHLITD
jgi:OOP family OmpA-OmpF porin